jgi:hypothetical protein
MILLTKEYFCFDLPLNRDDDLQNIPFFSPPTYANHFLFVSDGLVLIIR